MLCIALLLLAFLPQGLSETQAATSVPLRPPPWNADGTFDCTCRRANDKSGDFVCACDATGGFDCLCKRVKDPKNDFECKCGPDIGEEEEGGPGTGAPTVTPPTVSTPAVNKTVKAFVACVKPDPATDKPVSVSLMDKSKKKSIKVWGEWTYLRCKMGLVEAFKVSKAVYDDVKEQCQNLDYDHPQPTDDAHTASYPFLVDGKLTEYWSHRTAFTFNHEPPTPVDRCTGAQRLL